MALVLKFRRNAVDTNLQAGDDGIQLVSWVPRICRSGVKPPPVREVMRLRVSEDSHDNLATTLQTLHDAQDDALRYKQDRTEQHAVWLHSQLTNETNQRRACVQSIEGDFDTAWHGALSVDNKAELPMNVVRRPAWEATSSRTFPNSGILTGIAHLYDYTAAGTAVAAHDIVGDDIGARIGFFSMITPSNNLGKAWLGIRSVNKHGISDFEHTWQCESAGTLGTDAALAADATASPGGGGNTKVTITPGTATWAKRLTYKIDDEFGGGANNTKRGRFLFLLRTKVSAGEWDVRLHYGVDGMDDDNFRVGRTFSVTSTNWNILEADPCNIPAANYKAIDTSWAVNDFTIQVWARRTSGAGNLDLDCWYPLPQDEGFLILSGAEAGTTDLVYFGESPLGTTECVAFASGLPVDHYVRDHYNFRLPPGDGRIMLVWQRTTQSVLGDQIYLNKDDDGKYYECWRSLRGSE